MGVIATFFIMAYIIGGFDFNLIEYLLDGGRVDAKHAAVLGFPSILGGVIGAIGTDKIIKG